MQIYRLLSTPHTIEEPTKKKESNLETIEKYTNDRYGKLKSDIIDFTSMGDAGLSFNEVQDLYRKCSRGEMDVKDLANHFKQLQPNEDLLKKTGAIGTKSKGKRNIVVEGLRAQNSRAFEEINKDISNLRSRSTDKYLDDENWVDGKKPDVFDKVHEMYIAKEGPLLMSKRHQIVELLHKKYESDVLQGAKMEDHKTEEHRKAMEMAIINNADPQEISEGTF